MHKVYCLRIGVVACVFSFRCLGAKYEFTEFACPRDHGAVKSRLCAAAS